jgi:ATP-dependent Clp protease ATP-binding subunit ClpA
MFRGDTAALKMTMCAAAKAAKRLGHGQPRSEHLLLALCEGSTAVARTLREHGVTATTVEGFITRPGVAPAALEADRALLASVGVDLDELLAEAGPGALAPRSGKPPLLPLGGRRNGWGAADYRAAYEASLRLALARMERDHRPEHLLIALLDFDRGCAWLLERCGADPGRLRAAAQEEFPPPRRNAFIRAARSGTWKRRYKAIVRRYENTAGSPALKAV